MPIAFQQFIDEFAPASLLDSLLVKAFEAGAKWERERLDEQRAGEVCEWRQEDKIGFRTSCGCTYPRTVFIGTHCSFCGRLIKEQKT